MLEASYFCCPCPETSLILIRKLLLIAFVVPILFSCMHNDVPQSTWIGGEIVNPTSGYVVFAQGDRVIDTVPLDSNNFFLYNSNDLKEGLYILRHNETQVFYLQPGDSIMLHLNTVDFDESLAYSGKGSQKNNLLMEYFLVNEQENLNLPSWYGLSPAEFTKKIDSLRVLKEERYQEFLKDQKEVPSLFEQTVRAAIDYDYYMKKELYALANFSRLSSIDPSFFSYRAQVDTENEALRYYYPYYRYLLYYLDNLTLKKLAAHGDRFSFDFSNTRLEMIDSLIKNDSIRNTLSRNTALRFYFNGKEEEALLGKFLAKFQQINNLPKHNSEVKRVAKTASTMVNGKTIPHIALLTTENTSEDLHDLIHKPTVLFFWSYKSPTQAIKNHNRAAELKSKFPEYNFYGINTDNHYRQWRNYVLQEKYNEKEEFQLENPIDSEHSLLLNNLSKAIIIDKDLKILEGNSNMFHQNFEQLLLGYLNRR